ncbi:MAG TPA: hypothetical protein VGH24_07210, partial [Solirubrobacteraceae bacterium]
MLGYGAPVGLPSHATGIGPRLRASARYTSTHWRLLGFVLLGGLAAGVVGYVVAHNPHAAPAHLGIAVRVAIVATLVAAGAYAQTNTGQARIGALLVAAGLFASLWLLNGAANPTLFTIGLLLGGAAPTVFAYLMLAYPSGRLQSSGQRRLLVGAGGSMFVLWTFMVLTSRQPALTTPLLECGPHCPAN